jgi:hypothetical protein
LDKMSNMSDPHRSPRHPLVAAGEIDCHVVDMTVTIAAGVPLERAQAALAKHDQWIPIDGDLTLPIGQLVEENSTGPLRLGYGAWRDLLLGCQFTLADGRLITAGGMTMKNVAGYDLVKFMVGQRGQFGKIATITVRTFKRPAAALVAEFDPSDRRIEKFLTSPLRPRYAIIRPDRLLYGWLDDERSLNFFEHLAGAQNPRRLIRRSLQDDIEDRARIWNPGDESFRASLPPTRILEFAAAASLPDFSADAAFGVVIGPCKEIDWETIEKGARDVGGSATFLSRGRSPKWSPSAAEQRVLTALRNAFAPAG